MNTSLAIITPVLIGFILGPESLGGLLCGAVVTGAWGFQSGLKNAAGLTGACGLGCREDRQVDVYPVLFSGASDRSVVIDIDDWGDCAEQEGAKIRALTTDNTD